MEDKDSQSVTFLQLEGWSLEPEAFLFLRIAMVTLEDLLYFYPQYYTLLYFLVNPSTQNLFCYVVLHFSSAKDPLGTDHPRSCPPGHLWASLDFQAFLETGPNVSCTHLRGEWRFQWTNCFQISWSGHVIPLSREEVQNFLFVLADCSNANGSLGYRNRR